jgi:hypothetical protein
VVGVCVDITVQPGRARGAQQPARSPRISAQAPNTMDDAPPGGASTRLELRSVMKLPRFCKKRSGSVSAAEGSLARQLCGDCRKIWLRIACGSHLSLGARVVVVGAARLLRHEAAAGAVGGRGRGGARRRRSLRIRSLLRVRSLVHLRVRRRVRRREARGLRSGWVCARQSSFGARFLSGLGTRGFDRHARCAQEPRRLAAPRSAARQGPRRGRAARQSALAARSPGATHLVARRRVVATSEHDGRRAARRSQHAARVAVRHEVAQVLEAQSKAENASAPPHQFIQT